MKMAKKSEFKSIAIENLEIVDFNPNEMNKSQMEHLRKTIKERGFMQPLTVTPREDDPNKYIVIDGAHRLEVFKELERPSIPCYIVPSKKPIDIKIDLVNLNKIRGEFNQDKYNQLLNSIMGEVELDQMKELLNLEKTDLKEFEKFLTEKNKIDIDPETIEVSSYERAKNKTKIQLGDVYQLGNHRLMCGNSTKESNVRTLMNEQKADMVFTDPPYNIAYKDMKNKHEKIENDDLPEDEFLIFLKNSLKNIRGVSCLYICCNWKYYHLFYEAMKDINCPIKSCIVWDKEHGVQNLDKYFKQHEFILYSGAFGGQKTLRGDVFRLNREKSNLHPAMKPIKLCAAFILDSTDNKGKVIDLFGGSGSTLMACEQLNRVCFMMEIDPVYCQIIIDRWQDYTGHKAVKI